MSDYKPAIPAKLRSVVYFTGLGVGFVTMLATGLSAIWWADVASQVAATGVSVTAAVGWLASALGVAYRPTAQQAVAEADGFDPATLESSDGAESDAL